MDDIIMTVGLDPKDAIDKANDLQDAVKKIFDKTTGKSFGKDFDKQLNNIKKQMSDTSRHMEKLKHDMTQEGAKKIGYTSQYQKELDIVKQLRTELIKYKKEATNKKLANWERQTAKGNIRRTNAKIKYRDRKMQDLESKGEKWVMGTTTRRYKELGEALGSDINKMNMLVSAFRQLSGEAKTATDFSHRFSKGLENAKKAVNKVVSAIKIKKIVTPIAKAVKGLGKLTSRMLGINKASEKHNMSLKKMINQVLRYGLGIRSLFILWRKLRAYTADALKLMATQFKEVDADVSALMNSFNQMKLSFGTMAQPLMHALAPALIYIIELITRAMTALANFFAILTGQKFIYKAQKANDSYADSIKGVGGAAKEANKELAEYDNLLVIDQPKDGSGGGGGGAADGLTGTFEKTLAESDFAKELKAAIEKGDWEGVGSAFAEKLNIITEKFDNWINKKFRPKGVEWAKRIGRIINGWVDTWDGELFGKTVGDSLMSVMDIVATWWETVKWKNLGKKVADAVNGLFTSWEPKTVARFFTGKINAVIDFAAGMFDPETGVNFDLMGRKLGESIKNFIEDIHWDTLGADLSNLASGILTGLSSAIEESELGVTVGNAINEFLNGINFKQLGTDLFTLAMNILNALADLIKTVDWFEVGQAIADLLASIDWVKFIETLIDVALNLIGGLAQAIAGLVTNPKAVASLATALATLFAVKSIWKTITGVFKSNVATSVGTGVAQATSTGGSLFSKVKGLMTSFFSTTFGQVAGILMATVGAQSLIGSIGSVIAYAFGDEEMSAEYSKLAKNPIKYMKNAIGEIASAFKKECEYTGKSVLNTAWSDMWADLFGQDTTLDYANEYTQSIYDKTQEQFQRAQYSWDVMGRWVSDEEWEAFKNSCDDYVAKINELQEAAKGAGDAVEDMAGNILTLGEDIGTSADKYEYMNSELERLTKLYPQINVGQLSGIIGTSWNLFPEDTEARLDYIIKQIEHITGTVQNDGEKIEESIEQVGNAFEVTSEKGKYLTDAIDEFSNKYSQINVGQLASIISQAYDFFPENTTSDIYNRTKYIEQMINKLLGTVETSGEEMQKSVNNTTKSITLDADNATQSVVNSAKDSIDGIKNTWNEADVKGYFTERSNDVTESFNEVPTKLSDTFDTALNGVKTSFTQDALTSHFSAVKENIETPFKSLPSFFSDTFKQSWNEAESAFSSGNTTFNNFNAKLSEGMTNTINNLIGGLNSAVSGPLQKIQEVINKFRNVKIGASSLFSNLPSFSNIPSIPKLAQGAVIPPNREFLAMLGDQTNGTNIETPLETMVQAFKSALSEMGGSSTNQNIVLQLDGRTVAQCVWDEEDKRYKQTGRR